MADVFLSTHEPLKGTRISPPGQLFNVRVDTLILNFISGAYYDQKIGTVSGHSQNNFGEIGVMKIGFPSRQVFIDDL
jgi:hypothetical protein